MINKIKSIAYKFNYKTQAFVIAIVTLFSNILFFFPGANISSAQTMGIQVNSVSDLGSKVICPIFNAMFWVAMIVASIMILYAAYVYITAEDDAKKVSKGHHIILYAAIGVAVALFAKAGPTVVGSIFGVTGLTSC